MQDKKKVPRLNLKLLPNYHGNSNKSLNQSLLLNYEKMKKKWTHLRLFILPYIIWIASLSFRLLGGTRTSTILTMRPCRRGSGWHRRLSTSASSCSSNNCRRNTLSCWIPTLSACCCLRTRRNSSRRSLIWSCWLTTMWWYRWIRTPIGLVMETTGL